jgi:DNA-binding response OmpR family regulator
MPEEADTGSWICARAKLLKNCDSATKVNLSRDNGVRPMAGYPGGMPQLLVVEDDSNIRDLVCSHLRSEGYACVPMADGREALTAVRGRRFDVIVLDLMLPHVDGLAICRAIRHDGANRDVPILMLTARREEHDKLAGFDSGADDYLTKPFSMKELTARVAVLTRRTRKASVDPLASARPISVAGLHLDPARRSLRVHGTDIAVTPHEFRLLYLLAANRGVVFTRDRLLVEIWGGQAFVTDRSIDTLVRRLRCKVEHDPATPHCILTVWGEGYKFADG